MIIFYKAELPIETCSEANQRGHWSRKAKRAKTQRADARYWCRIKFGLITIPVDTHIHIQLVRLAPRELDSDNLASAFKAVRDGIADYLGIDDGDKRLHWEYTQEKLSKTRSMRVQITYDK